MTIEEIKNLMESLTDYSDSETKATLELKASVHEEIRQEYVINADIILDKEKVGEIIFTFLIDKNSLKLSYSDMSEELIGQGIGGRYVEYATNKASQAGADYIFANAVSDVAKNMYVSAGWTTAPSELGDAGEILALKL